MRPHQSPRLSRDIEASKVHMSLKMDVTIAGIRTLDLAHASRALCLSPNPKRVSSDVIILKGYEESCFLVVSGRRREFLATS